MVRPSFVLLRGQKEREERRGASLDASDQMVSVEIKRKKKNIGIGEEAEQQAQCVDPNSFWYFDEGGGTRAPCNAIPGRDASHLRPAPTDAPRGSTSKHRHIPRVLMTCR